MCFLWQCLLVLLSVISDNGHPVLCVFCGSTYWYCCLSFLTMAILFYVFSVLSDFLTMTIIILSVAVIVPIGYIGFYAPMTIARGHLDLPPSVCLSVRLARFSV